MPVKRRLLANQHTITKLDECPSVPAPKILHDISGLFGGEQRNTVVALKYGSLIMIIPYKYYEKWGAVEDGWWSPRLLGRSKILFNQNSNMGEQ